MPKLFAIGLIAALSAVAPSYASEDAAPYVFGGDVNYEVQGQDSIASQFTSGEDDLFNFSDVESLSAEHTAIPAENPMEAPDDAAPMDENDIPDAEAIASPAENLPTASVPMLQAPGTTPPPPSSSAAADEKTPMPKISKDQALTDTLKQDKTPGTAQNVIPLPKVEGTWVDKLATTNPLSILGDGKAKTSAAGTVQGSGDSLESLVESARRPSAGNSRSNASVFDISGVMLRMSLKQVDETMQNRGFRKIMQKYQIPNFIKWRNEEGCRHSGVVGYERLEACVVERAKKAKQQYVQLVKYAKFDTKEEIQVTFTSNFTDNKVYKITYKSLAAGITGNSPKAIYLRNIKIYDFWKKINQKYGKPDNKEAVTWGMGGNKPYLKAKTGFLLLEDPMLRELDYTRMSREDQRYMNTDLYSF